MRSRAPCANTSCSTNVLALANSVSSLEDYNIVASSEVSPTELLSPSLVSKIQELSDGIRQERVALFVGSGLSKRRGLPLWNELVSNLIKAWQLREPSRDLRRLHPDNFESIVRQHFGDNNSSIVSFLSSRLESFYLPNDLKFGHVVVSALYANPKLPKVALIPSPDDVHRHLVLLFRNHPGRIWTTNYDDLLEVAADECMLDVAPLDIIHRMSHPRLEIAHIHGFIPPETRRYFDIEPGNEQFVLAEDDYYAVGADPTGWPNRELHRLFDDHVCLMVGMSLSDPNLRRVLSVLKSKNRTLDIDDRPMSNHVAVLPETSSEKLQVKRIRRGTRKAIASEANVLQNDFWDQYGVDVLHVPHYDSVLPLLVRLRYESEGEKPGDLWCMGAKRVKDDIQPWSPPRISLADKWFTAALKDIQTNFGVPAEEIVEIGLFLMSDDAKTVELVYRYGAERISSRGSVRFSIDPDNVQGVAGRVLVSGEVARIRTDHPLFNFNLPGRESTSRNGASYEGIISAPIFDWERLGVPLGVIYLTVSDTNGVLFSLKSEDEAKAEERTIEDLFKDLDNVARTFLCAF